MLILTLCFAATSGARGESIKRGDVNRDGRVDVSDVVRLFEWLAKGDAAPICWLAADLNDDGDVDYSDLVVALAFIFDNDQERPVLPPDPDSCLPERGGLEFTGPQLTSLSPVSAMVSWGTALRADTKVRLWRDPSGEPEETVIDESVTSHQVLLANLIPSTSYMYQFVSKSSSGLSAESDRIKFHTLESPTFSVRPDHPRILLNATDLPRLKSAIASGGEAADLWKELTTWCDSKLETALRDFLNPTSADQNVQAMAFAAMLSGSKNYRYKAIEAGLYLAHEGLPEDIRAAIEALAYVYDWLYDKLTDDQKETVRDALVSNMLILDANNKDQEYVVGHTHGNHKSLILGALAAHGDSSQATRLTEELYTNYRYGFLATWRRFAGTDGGSSKGWWYTTYVLPFETEFFAAWRSATGEDLFLSERVWCEGVLDWFLFGMRGDGSFIREGDTRIFNGLNYQNRHFGYLLGKEYGNAQGQWLANQSSEETPVWGPHAVFDILWRDRDVVAKAPSGSTSRLFQNVGVAVMRESWKKDSVVASFRSAEVYTLGHTHRDNCAFTIFYKGGLALDSGLYDDYGSKHRDNYYSRTVAHNTITVFDPDEEFKIYGSVFSNDGGQRWLVPGEDVPHYWPAVAEDTVERSTGYRLGGISRYESEEDYTYVVGNGGPSYNKKKLKRFLRHFLWLKDGTGWNHPVIVVFDDIISTKAAFKKTYLLHTENQPSIDGSWVVAENGGGKLYQKTLLPEASVATPIGGPGKEFWVNGRNYPALRGEQDKEEAGAWRVEISPAAPSTDDRFLHVLYPGESDAKAPTEPRTFTVDKFQACTIGTWMVFFDFGAPLEGLEYRSEEPASSHLLFGAVPGASYDVYVDGSYRQSVVSSYQGTLRFDLDHSGAVRVSRKMQ